MDASIEKRFVKSFIRKKNQERLLYELTTPRKRYAGVSRFCHQAGDLLDSSKIFMEGDDLDRCSDFKRFVQSRSEVCYVMSPDPWLDTQRLPFSQAVERAAICCDAVLIIGEDFAVVFTEPMKGGREKYLLAERTSRS